MVTAAPDEVPSALVQQLAVGGLMAIPVGTVTQQLRILRRTATGMETLRHPSGPVRTNDRQTVTSRKRLVLRRDVALSRARLQSALRTRTSMSCTLPSRLGGAKPSRYWLCSSSATLGERGAEILPEANLDVAAAGLLRDAREAGIRQVGQSAPPAGRPDRCPAASAAGRGCACRWRRSSRPRGARDR